MIDIHCHILPGLDDGSSSMDESVEMALMAWAGGTTHMVATPHISRCVPAPEKIKSLCDELMAAIRGKDPSCGIEILWGGEVDANDSLECAPPYAINGTKYILLEFNANLMPMTIKEVVFGHRVKGFIPVMAHAERSGAIINVPALAGELVEAGCLMQVTAASILGEFGPDIKSIALRLLKEDAAHVVASDSHSPGWRPPGMSDAFEHCGKALGADRARELFVDNPARIIRGEVISGGR